MTTSQFKAYAVFGFFLLLQNAPTVLAQGSNMLGRQSQNSGLLIVPTPGEVKVDGQLEDWDLSGRIWCFADKDVRERYSAEVAGMWDKEHLYLAIKWRDPTPMTSKIDPRFNPQYGWKSDALQLRVRTDQTMAITTWYYGQARQSALEVGTWKEPDNERGGYNKVLLVSQPGGHDLGQGVEMAYRKDGEGGYIQEIKLPWRILYRQPKVLESSVFQMGMEFLWGDASGENTGHRYADNLQPGETSREFFWSKYKVWGEARLTAQNGVPLKQYLAEGERLRGNIPVRFQVPTGARRFTAVLEDQNGMRVRNLAGGLDVRDYVTVAAVPGSNVQNIEISWDGLDDNGKSVAPGTYRVRGLAHAGLDATFDTVYYNPGTPPWSTADGSGAWGGDHSAPSLVARSGDWMIAGWGTAEGGSGMIGLDPDGRKKWGEKSAPVVLAADAAHVYAVVRGFGLRDDLPLVRLNQKDGAYQPFTLAGKPRPFLLRLSEIIGDKGVAGAGPAAFGQSGSPAQAIPQAAALAAGSLPGAQGPQAVLALALQDGRLALLDSNSAQVLAKWQLEPVLALAFAADGRLYGLFEKRVASINLKTGALQTIATPGVERGAALTCDAQGNLAVYDAGPDSQVKIFSPEGKLLRTAGQKGGRPRHGHFLPEGMMRVSSIAADANNSIWATERWDYPRRISVWGLDGKLVRDYIGNTGYSATGAFLDPVDEKKAYLRAVEMSLDRENGTYKVESILWNPDADQGQAFALQPVPKVRHWFANPTFFSSQSSGRELRYLQYHGGHLQHALYMERNGYWPPVAAITSVDELGRQLPRLDLSGQAKTDLVFWHDANRDTKVTREELRFVPNSKRTTGGYWGTGFDENLRLTIDGGKTFTPTGFTPEGAPIYEAAGMGELGRDESGDFLSVTSENQTIILSRKRYPQQTPGLLAVDSKTGKARWTYPGPYNGVHGSHEAPMPLPGSLIGPLKFAGLVNAGPGVGKVFLLRGNLGQDFLMTTDGLFVGALFQDTRLPGASLPASVAELKGRSLLDFSEGGEPFNGWFGKQGDGKVRLTMSLVREGVAVAEVHGLDKISRWAGPDLTVDAAALAGAALAAPRLLAVGPRTAQVQRLTPTIDGMGTEWKDALPLPLEKAGQPTRGTLKLGYDATNLYAYFEVTDASPWLNGGKDLTRLFKTGDALDLQLGVATTKGRRNPSEGDLRVVISNMAGKPVAVVMQPVQAGAVAGVGTIYSSPVFDKPFDRVQLLTNARIAVARSATGYRVEVALPWQELGIQPAAGLRLGGDAGIIVSDADGTTNVARIYWSNLRTNLVNDLPGEAWFDPSQWGEWVLD